MGDLDRAARKVLIDRFRDQQRHIGRDVWIPPVTDPEPGTRKGAVLELQFDSKGRSIPVGSALLSAGSLARRGSRSARFVAATLKAPRERASDEQRAADQNNRACALLLADRNGNLAKVKRMLTALGSKSHAEANLALISRMRLEKGS